MHETSDTELVREFVREGSEIAFAELVKRHLNLVYSVALRFTANPEDARDVAQAVFVILAQKAASLDPHTVLTGWLYEATRLTALHLLRAQARRQARDQEAYMQSSLNEPQTNGAWSQLASLLEPAMARLSTGDRTLIALRFYENKSAAGSAALLGVSEAAVHKRTARALEKLRLIFNKKGVRLTTVIIAGAISANSLQAAPAGTTQAIATIAMAKGAAAGPSTLTLVKGALKIMAWTKAKTAILVSAGLLLTTATATVGVKEFQEHRHHAWQVPQADFGVFYKTPPQVVIVPTKFGQDGHAVSDGSRGTMGIAQPIEEIIMRAYQTDKLRTVFAAPIPPGKYDFFAKMPGVSQTEPPQWAFDLQREIAKKFGLAGHMENRETDVLVLQPSDTGIRGFTESHEMPDGIATRGGPGKISCFKQPLSTLIFALERAWQIPIVDQTGLTGSYDYSLEWDEPDPAHHNLEGLEIALKGQLGLQLVHSREKIEKLVVERVK